MSIRHKTEKLSVSKLRTDLHFTRSSSAYLNELYRQSTPVMVNTKDQVRYKQIMYHEHAMELDSGLWRRGDGKHMVRK